MISCSWYPTKLLLLNDDIKIRVSSSCNKYSFCHFSKFKKENIRPDGRELGEFRATLLNVGTINTAHGSALVKLGNTTILCGVKGEFAAPPVNEPKKGYLVPNVELPPLCSSQFKVGPPSEQAQVVSQLIDDIVRSSNLINLESLNIAEGVVLSGGESVYFFCVGTGVAPGFACCWGATKLPERGPKALSKLSWVLHCDMICLDYDGNIVDASLIALLAALKNVLLPAVRIDEDTGRAVTSQEGSIPLKLSCQPVATSFVVFDDTILLADPTKEEEGLATGAVTVVVNEEGDICSVHKPGKEGALYLPRKFMTASGDVSRDLRKLDSWLRKHWRVVKDDVPTGAYDLD
ncbi:Exosome complex component RRP43 [Holothuria leucospilota]|uniref:Ribosomal RNA-processing protein 43 n=1 Tax=Holothuria leucospilota TaxID=206669 RepID=A0A9Q1GXM2_HOLLE|nr:Exosome complex component RRP43 [Holothuria leucospilota]